MEIKLTSTFKGLQRVPKLGAHFSSPNVPIISDGKVQGLPIVSVLAILILPNVGVHAKQIHAIIQELVACPNITLSDTKIYIYKLQLFFCISVFCLITSLNRIL